MKIIGEKIPVNLNVRISTTDDRTDIVGVGENIEWLIEDCGVMSYKEYKEYKEYKGLKIPKNLRLTSQKTHRCSEVINKDVTILLPCKGIHCYECLAGSRNLKYYQEYVKFKQREDKLGRILNG